MHSEKPLFLCTGMPKSGTTFLQRTLNLHPDVSCPAEHSFLTLTNEVERLFANYAGLLRLMDKRTGGQGATIPGEEVSRATLKAMFLAIARAAGGAKPILGLNDNSVFERAPFYEGLLDRPKIVAIIRNPVDLAISAWRFNRRLAKLEPQNAQQFLGILRNPQGNVDGYAIQLTETYYRRNLSRFLDYASGRDHVCVVLYELLLSNKKRELKRVFEFLGAATDEATLDAIVEGSSRKAMAKSSSSPQFFAAEGREEVNVSRATREKVLKDVWPLLERVGYDFPALMMGQ